VTQQRQRNGTAHYAPSNVAPSRRHSIQDGGVSIDDNCHRDDPLTGGLRAEGRRGNQQDANADPVDGAGLPDPTQQVPRPLRLDMRLGEHSQLGDGAVCDGDKNGQYARDLKSQISHHPPPYRTAW